MGSATVAFFMIHSNRSRKAFEALIEDWKGILVSDGYGVYIKWAGMRQCCLAHLIRKANGLSERKDPGMARCGKWARDELLRLCKMATAPPSVGEWNMFYTRFLRLIALYGGREDVAGKLVRRLQSEMENLLSPPVRKCPSEATEFLGCAPVRKCTGLVPSVRSACKGIGGREEGCIPWKFISESEEPVA